MASEEITYDARCQNGHLTRLTFPALDLPEQLRDGTLVLYCAVCDAVRSPAPDERKALLALAQSDKG